MVGFLKDSCVIVPLLLFVLAISESVLAFPEEPDPNSSTVPSIDNNDFIQNSTIEDNQEATLSIQESSLNDLRDHLRSFRNVYKLRGNPSLIKQIRNRVSDLSGSGSSRTVQQDEMGIVMLQKESEVGVVEDPDTSLSDTSELNQYSFLLTSKSPLIEEISSEEVIPKTVPIEWKGSSQGPHSIVHETLVITSTIYLSLSVSMSPSLEPTSTSELESAYESEAASEDEEEGSSLIEDSLDFISSEIEMPTSEVYPQMTTFETASIEDRDDTPTEVIRTDSFQLRSSYTTSQVILESKESAQTPHKQYFVDEKNNIYEIDVPNEEGVAETLNKDVEEQNDHIMPESGDVILGKLKQLTPKLLSDVPSYSNAISNDDSILDNSNPVEQNFDWHGGFIPEPLDDQVPPDSTRENIYVDQMIVDDIMEDYDGDETELSLEESSLGEYPTTYDFENTEDQSHGGELLSNEDEMLDHFSFVDSGVEEAKPSIPHMYETGKSLDMIRQISHGINSIHPINNQHSIGSKKISHGPPSFYGLSGQKRIPGQISHGIFSVAENKAKNRKTTIERIGLSESSSMAPIETSTILPKLHKPTKPSNANIQSGSNIESMHIEEDEWDIDPETYDDFDEEDEIYTYYYDYGDGNVEFIEDEDIEENKDPSLIFHAPLDVQHEANLESLRHRNHSMWTPQEEDSGFESNDSNFRDAFNQPGDNNNVHRARVSRNRSIPHDFFSDIGLENEGTMNLMSHFGGVLLMAWWMLML